MKPTLNRRRFLGQSSALLGGLLCHDALAEEKQPVEPIIDIHQHTHYHGRTDETMLKHQRAMGVTTTILLPAGQAVNRPSTHAGKSNGLAAKTGGNATVLAMAKKHPKEFVFGANEVPDLLGMQKELEKFLKAGAVVIGGIVGGFVMTLRRLSMSLLANRLHALELVNIHDHRPLERINTINSLNFHLSTIMVYESLVGDSIKVCRIAALSPRIVEIDLGFAAGHLNGLRDPVRPVYGLLRRRQSGLG